MLREMDFLWIHSTLKSTRWERITCFHSDQSEIVWEKQKKTEWKHTINNEICFLSVQKLKAHLTHHSLSSSQLVEKFLEKKICEQVRQPPASCSSVQKCVNLCKSICSNSVSASLHIRQKVYSGEKYGAVTLLTSYRRSDQKLSVEVLNAVNLLPMDSNGEPSQYNHNHNHWHMNTKRPLLWDLSN